VACREGLAFLATHLSFWREPSQRVFLWSACAQGLGDVYVFVGPRWLFDRGMSPSQILNSTALCASRLPFTAPGGVVQTLSCTAPVAGEVVFVMRRPAQPTPLALCGIQVRRVGLWRVGGGRRGPT
jgi:hypothetical protein